MMRRTWLFCFKDQLEMTDNPVDCLGFFDNLKELCGYNYNPLYMAQLLVDSTGLLGGKVTKYTWR